MWTGLGWWQSKPLVLALGLVTDHQAAGHSKCQWNQPPGLSRDPARDQRPDEEIGAFNAKPAARTSRHDAVARSNQDIVQHGAPHQGLVTWSVPRSPAPAVTWGPARRSRLFASAQSSPRNATRHPS